MIASLATLLIPLWILLGLLVLLAALGLLGRIQNGRYLRPLITLISKVPLFRRWLQKASTAALERSNPDLASAMKKMVPQLSSAPTIRTQAQTAMSRLTSSGAPSPARYAGSSRKLCRAEATNRQDAPPPREGQRDAALAASA